MTILIASCSAEIEPGTTGTTFTPTSPATSQPSSPATSLVAVTTTAPDHSSSLLVIGDWGSETDDQRDVAEAMRQLAETMPIEAILTTGDNFYGDDEESIMEPFAWAVSDGVPFWIAWGNHDIESKERMDDINSVFGNPPRWTVHRWGDVEIVILDSNQVTNEQQLDFLDAEMSRIEAPTIVVFHHPPLSCSSHGDTQGILDSWVPIFDEDVVLVLSGHDHNYQRFEQEGAVYVVTGGGGRHIYDVEECPQQHPKRIRGSAIHHFLVMNQAEDSLAILVVNLMGDTIDSFEIEIR